MAVLLAFVLTLSASGAMAAPPRLDVEDSCERATYIGDGINLPAFNYCVDLQQRAYDDIKAGWHGYPEPIRKQCAQTITNTGGASYEFLRYCMDAEVVGPVKKKTFSY